MKRRTVWLRLPAILATWILGSLSIMTSASWAQPAHRLDQALAELSARVGAEVEVRISRSQGTVTFLSTPPGTSIPVSHRGSAEEVAQAFLSEQSDLFGLDEAPSRLITTRIGFEDEIGMEMVRFQQTYHGIPVTGGELSVHMHGSSVVAVHAKTLPGLGDVETLPAIEASFARELAIESIVKHLGRLEVALSEPRLEILDRGHLGGPPLSPRLTWFVEATGVDLRDFMWIDARSGVVLLQFSQLNDSLHRRVFDAKDPADGIFNDLPGMLVREEGDLPTGDTDTDLAYDFAGDTYDYFFDEHGRDSYDDAGAMLLSTVHFCPNAGSCPFANAFWNGTQMVYGDGFSAADDVVAHELTHAVTEHSANLFYYMQSGALNESYSDIFGETVDLLNGSGLDSPGVRWQMGEDLTPGGIRNMKDPNPYGDPAKMSDSELLCTSSVFNDSGGVHINSGIPNKAYVLMVDGGTFNGMTVTGLGLTKAAKIQYRALTRYLLSASDFLDNYDAVLRSCTDLIGEFGITATDCIEVGQALDAVEMDHAFCFNPTPSNICSLAEFPRPLFREDFEELAGGDTNDTSMLSNWQQNVIQGAGHWSACCLGPFASDGTGNLHGIDWNFAADSAIEMTTDVSIPVLGASLRFHHSWGFEFAFDGGVLEYSTNGGGTWIDAGALIDEGPGYNGTIASGFGNPLGDRSAFVGDSSGYSVSRIDLESLGGQSARFRFRMGTDSPFTNAQFNDYGWFIDDFYIYTCSSACQPTLVLDSGIVTEPESYIACDSISAGDGFRVGPSGRLTLDAPLVQFENGFSISSGGAMTVFSN